MTSLHVKATFHISRKKSYELNSNSSLSFYSSFRIKNTCFQLDLNKHKNI